MAEQKVVTSTVGVGFFMLLAILFIALKLTNVVNWSWLLVLAPLWGPVAFALAIIAITFTGVVRLFGLAFFIDLLKLSTSQRNRKTVAKKLDTFAKGLTDNARD